ncbi:leucine zipper putative tumor suppressor 1 [Boleophthalmus pectinirostris]|uniref:leucine zipper putative tumor suppressor 1 n=1 Tax=Boleophthalmus pectinirostris TaxID=150288 RepID=UPI00242E9CD2|nr:leucine zipper putative tumor suppressor 1 [Boleophthalmus pectinirostris]
MGSVSSLVTGSHSLSAAKHCRASGPRPRQESREQRKSGGCSLDDLLKCSFSPGSSSRPTKGLTHSRSGRSEDFFYIKVSQKPRSKQFRGSAMENSDSNSDEETSPKLLYKTLTDRTSTEQPLVRAFTPVVSRNTTSTETGHKSMDHILGSREKTSPDVIQRTENLSGTLSDSGRNSMSSLPTHSTGDSLGPASHRDSSSPAAHSLSKALLPTFPSWLNGTNVSPESRYSPAFNSPVSKANANANGSQRAGDKSSPLSETTGGIRSPITADDSLIEHLEHQLLERESELHRLQVSLEEKGAEACQRFEERHRHCADEIEGLKQQCRIQQTVNKSPQGIHLQFSKLQEERQRLEDLVLRLTQEKEQMQMRLRAYETHGTALAPTLEETQWEVCQKSGEIFLLKQQLRDSQADVSHKLSEILNLRILLKDVTTKMETFERQSREHEDKLHTRTREAEVCQNELQRRKSEANMLRDKVCKLESDIEALKQDLSVAKEQGTPQTPSSPIQTDPLQCLQEEVDILRQQVQSERDAKDKLSISFEQEKQTWNKEKEKVIKYQKQLQINYLQMHKKNRELERSLKEITAELEAKTELRTDIPYCSGLQTYEDVIATEI